VPDEQPRAERCNEGTHAVNVSNEHSADLPRSARRFDRMARFPVRINTVVTARSAFMVPPLGQELRARKSAQTPKPRCPLVRRAFRRETRAAILKRSRPRPAPPVFPAREPRRKCPPERPQERGGDDHRQDDPYPDEASPGFRHARGPRRRLRTDRRECCRRPAIATASACTWERFAESAIRKSWHRSLSVMREVRPACRLATKRSRPLGLGSRHRLRRGMLVYCIRCDARVNPPAPRSSRTPPFGEESRPEHPKRHFRMTEESVSRTIPVWDRHGRPSVFEGRCRFAADPTHSRGASTTEDRAGSSRSLRDTNSRTP
jgi:hypothetical protein